VRYRISGIGLANVRNQRTLPLISNGYLPKYSVPLHLAGSMPVPLSSGRRPEEANLCNLTAVQHGTIHSEGTFGSLAPVIELHTLLAQLALHCNSLEILQG